MPPKKGKKGSQPKASTDSGFDFKGWGETLEEENKKETVQAPA